jgi:Rrf2 family nitric oxide-sensitive transcriptional repressor
MRLTLHTDYALRVLMYAGAKGEALSTIAEIAERFDISKGHVMKVVHRLAQKGYLETTRGKKGGFRLAQTPDQINVGAIIRDMGEDFAVLGCLERAKGYCRIEECCLLRTALRDAIRAFLATLDRYTLQDLLKPRQKLARLLEIDPALGAAAGSASAR